MPSEDEVKLRCDADEDGEEEEVATSAGDFDINNKAGQELLKGQRLRSVCPSSSPITQKVFVTEGLRKGNGMEVGAGLKKAA